MLLRNRCASEEKEKSSCERGGGRIPDSQSGQQHPSQHAGRSLSLPFWNGPLSSCRARSGHGFIFAFGRW